MCNETISSYRCVKCNKQFNKQDLSVIDGKFYCDQCVVGFADKFIEEKNKLEDKELEKTPTRGRRVWRLILLCLVFLCLGINIILISRMMNSLKGDKIIRKGTIETDAKTDQCIENLWRISRILQEGKLQGKDLVCPITKEPYVVKQEKEDIVVCCPNPGRHGFKEIRVSRSLPVPELIEYK